MRGEKTVQMQDKLYEIIASVCYFDKEELHPGLSVEGDLAITSVMIVEIIAMVESRLDVNLEEHVDELLSCETLGELTALTAELSSEHPQGSLPGR
ncbi:acyl carrier protein [Paenibacillus sp. FSL H8-0259]|uniref:acyl carrier protein n=2 Tax=Paenibacillus TaxID=44249 RepID=UPI0009FB75BD|nr:acyl carrier protein [Paenibacillus sp. FSL H8-0259]